MSNYLIRLKPLGKFFFGSDQTFQVGSDEQDRFNRAYASYIIESNLFPQQTSLLGMLRYLLLTLSPESVFSDNRIKNPQKAETLIGSTSFQVTGNENNFGCIKSLGPCLLMQQEDIWLPAPKDYLFRLKFSTEKRPEVSYNGLKLRLPEIRVWNEKEGTKENYNVKKEYDTLYINLKTGSTCKTEAIFQKDTRIGINKNYYGKSGEKGFYKQISYQLKDGFHFAFTADVDFDLSSCQHKLVSLGADGSRFILSAEKLEQDSPNMLTYPASQLENPQEAVRVVLLSDTRLQPKDTHSAIFNIAETKPFRFLNSSSKTNNYHILGGDVTRSREKYYLYEKGSVFYFTDSKQAATFIEKVHEQKDFHQIGYNYCIQI